LNDCLAARVVASSRGVSTLRGRPRFLGAVSVPGASTDTGGVAGFASAVLTLAGRPRFFGAVASAEEVALLELRALSAIRLGSKHSKAWYRDRIVQSLSALPGWMSLEDTHGRVARQTCTGELLGRAQPGMACILSCCDQPQPRGHLRLSSEANRLHTADDLDQHETRNAEQHHVDSLFLLAV